MTSLFNEQPAGISPILLNRYCFKIHGDSQEFLQGLLSQDTDNMGVGELCYGLMLNPQGRFLYDLFFWQDPMDNAMVIDIHAPWSVLALKKLSTYNLRQKVRFEELASMCVYSLLPHHMPSKLPSTSWGNIFLDPRCGAMGKRLYGPMLESNGDNDGTPLGTASTVSMMTIYHRGRWEQGIPEGPWDLIQERSIPVECGLDKIHSISWTKGCYIGQELTARTHYGQMEVRKALVPVTVDLSSSDTIGEWLCENVSQPLVGLGITIIDSHHQKVGVLQSFYPGNDDTGVGFGFALLSNSVVSKNTGFGRDNYSSVGLHTQDGIIIT